MGDRGRNRHELCPPFPEIDIGAMVIVWIVEEKLSGLFCAIYCPQQLCSVQRTHTHINIPNSLWIGLSHWAQFTVLRFIFMAALRSRCGHYIFILSFLLFFFPRLISAVAEIGCLPYFHTWCGLSANLECRSETCCKRIAEIGLQDAKNRHLGTIAQLCRAISLQLRHVSTIGKKAC